MTRKLPQKQREARRVLGGELRRLRVTARLSNAAIAQAIGRSAATVTLIERGDRAISPDQIEAWVRAVSVPGHVPAREDLEYIAEVAGRATDEMSALSGTIAARQADVEELEREARVITNFQPCFVPGLLQTIGYARAVYETLKSPEQVEAAVKARLRRQRALEDPSRRFAFLLTESALRWRPQGPDPRPAQLSRVVTVAAFPNVDVEVIPSGAVMFTAPVVAFVLYEGDDGEGVAVVETLNRDVRTAEVKAYQDELALLRRSALSGDEAVAWIAGLAARLG
jgi:transcriptional regulator with XRE-family HTH domain